MVSRLNKQVLRLDIAMAVAESVNVGKGTEGLIGVEFDEDDRHLLLHFVVMFEDAVDGFWHVVHYDVQIYLILLVTLSVESVLQFDDVRMGELLHDLQFTILVALILVDLLDRDLLTIRALPGRLKDNTERAITDDSVRIVRTVHLMLEEKIRTNVSYPFQ